MSKACVNLDWLNVMCVEPPFNPRDAEYFRNKGYEVQERAYGTPTCAEMFTILDQNVPILEIRRKPYSLKCNGGVFEEGACFIRLSNRTCYYDYPINLLRAFLLEHNYTYRKISRIDICLDFNTFDTGDAPDKFIARYMAGKFSKINQANITAHGKDKWNGRFFNSLKWGSKTSMVTTKLYCKSIELQETHDKPYIRQAWLACGLINDINDRTTPIWRVEFSISSTVSDWFMIENQSGKKTKLEKWPHTLDRYDTRDKLLFVFHSLAAHYFHFKHVETLPNGDLKRKSLCKDKQLFMLSKNSETYKIGRVTSQKSTDRFLYLLIRKLESFKWRSDIDNETHAEIENVIEFLKCEMRRELINTDLSPFEKLADKILALNDAPFVGTNPLSLFLANIKLESQETR